MIWFDKFKKDNRKKGGFTLIEVIAVIAIIGMIAAILLPKVGGYIKEAKKLKVVENSRKVVMAVESYNLKAGTSIDDNTTVGAAVSINGVKQYIDGSDISNLNENSTTVGQCYDIVNGAEFDFEEGSEILDPATLSHQ